jgi:hypothetical protein
LFVKNTEQQKAGQETVRLFVFGWAGLDLLWHGQIVKVHAEIRV